MQNVNSTNRIVKIISYSNRGQNCMAIVESKIHSTTGHLKKHTMHMHLAPNGKDWTSQTGITFVQ